MKRHGVFIVARITDPAAGRRVALGGRGARGGGASGRPPSTADPPRPLSSRILILRGGILMPIGNFPEVLSQAILVDIISVGRLGVRRCLPPRARPPPRPPPES